MRKLLSFMVVSLFTISGFTQNLDFENWDQNTILILDDYNTMVSDNPMFGNLSVMRSTDHTDGSYSIRLETALSTNNDTIFGYFANGDPENFSGGAPTSLTNVDSIIGYYKYDIMPGDTALILCIGKYNGSVTGGNFFPIVGTQSTWTRFAYPVSAVATDTVITAAASSNAVNNIGITPGSYIMFDNVQLKSNTLGTENIPNYSFENWTDFIWEDLAGGWLTTNRWASFLPILPVSKTTDAYSGTYACKLSTQFYAPSGDTIQGFMSFGEYTQSGPMGGFPYSDQPDSVRWHFKSSFAGTDTAWVNIEFKKNGVGIAWNGEGVYSNDPVYQTTTQAVYLSQAPDTVFIAVSSGRNPGSEFIIDKIEFLFPVGVYETYNIQQIVEFPNPATDKLNFSMSFYKENNATIDIYSVDGKLLSTKNFYDLSGHNEVSVNISDLANGTYIYKVSVGNETYTKTFIKN